MFMRSKDYVVNVLPSRLGVRLSKAQRLTLEKLAKNYKSLISMSQSKAWAYLKSFKGHEASDLYLFRESKATSYELSCHNSKLRNLYKARFELDADHRPFSLSKRYFGIEIECLVSKRYVNAECSCCDGTGSESTDCDYCDGVGTHTSDCDECNGTGAYTNIEGVEIECSSCDGTGTHTSECDDCHGTGTHNSDCSHCDGSGRDYHDAMSSIRGHLEGLKIPFLSVAEDGSIDESSGQVGCEVRLMVCKDTLGNIKIVTDALKKIGGDVNESCGLHVHLDTRHLDEEEFKVAAKRLEKSMLLLRQTMPEHRRDGGAYNSAGMSFSDRYKEVNASRNCKTTIEVRNHEATIDHKEIINWIRTLDLAINASELDSMKSSFDYAAERAIETLSAINASPRIRRYILERIKTNHRAYATRILQGIKHLDEKKNKTITHSMQIRLGA